MNYFFSNILNEIKKFFLEDQNIQAILKLGSIGRNCEDYFSDIDLLVYTDFPEKTQEDVLRFIELQEFKLIYKFEKYDKLIFYLFHLKLNYFFKLEISFSTVSKIKDDLVFLVESRIKNPEDSILIDKINILELLKKYWYSVDEKKQTGFDQILNSFIYYYDLFLLNMTRGDVFRSYMNYTIAFYKLASMLAIKNGEFKNLYQPWFLTRDILPENDREILKKCVVRFDPLEMTEKKEILRKKFLEATLTAAKQNNISLDIENLNELFLMLERKYYKYYNFRDISKIINFCDNNKLKQSVIYRSASLSRYNIEQIDKILKEYNIKTIIDLRTHEDLERFSRYAPKYDKVILSIPVDPYHVIKLHEDPYKNLYLNFVYNFKKQIKAFFEGLNSALDKGGVLVHCEGGKDRTGVFVALLLWVLGIDKDCIKEDYLATYSDTKDENLNLIFDTIEQKFDGIENYLVYECEINPYIIYELKKKLITD